MINTPDDSGRKIKTLEEAVDTLAPLRRAGRKIVHCHGVFDLLHVGHLRHLKAARELGDVLVVTLTPDPFVNKGPGRPAFTAALRAEALAMLECVDLVAINRWPTAVEVIQLLKPHYYVKGSEYREAVNDVTGGIVREQEAVECVGGQLAFTDDLTFSSSKLINRYFAGSPTNSANTSLPSPAASGRRGHQLPPAAKGLKVLLVGEAIIERDTPTARRWEKPERNRSSPCATCAPTGSGAGRSRRLTISLPFATTSTC